MLTDLDLALAGVPWDGQGVIVGRVVRRRRRERPPRTTCLRSGGTRTLPDKGTQRGDSTEHRERGQRRSAKDSLPGVRKQRWMIDIQFDDSPPPHRVAEIR